MCHPRQPLDQRLAVGRVGDALQSMDIVWTRATIARLFEIGPNAMTPGTKMPEQRITDPADRQALVEWLARVTQP